MCGISGIYNFNNSKTVREADVTAMRDSLIHRGPDSSADYISKDKRVALSQRRLAIIDLSQNAACPMPNADRSVWITYNGEIYNFKSLREELKKSGYEFKTKGDTEVILYGYEKWGYDVVKKLNGMFAFALWDEKKKIFFAARDHMGIKPFYYAEQNGTLYFGSEIKAILTHPEFKKELNEVGISQYLTFGSMPAPHTLFTDVKKLPAAQYLIIENGKLFPPKEYWNPLTNAGQTPLTEGQYIDEVRSLLKDSIKNQMVSDVPFGCFLSGGIDSSTNASLMSEALGKPVETFSVGYKDFETKNEFVYSRRIAKELHAKNHELMLDESNMREFLPLYAQHADDPVSDQVCFPLFWLSKLTKNSGVTVIQIGEGSDELFAGYDAYLKWLSLHNLPKLVTAGALNALRIFNPSKSEFANAYLSNTHERQEPFWGLAIAFGDEMKKRLIRTNSDSYGIVNKYYREAQSKNVNADYLQQMTYLELKHRLPEFLLARADKMTMAHSVEGRVPFLDTRLVELALNMPTNIKIKNKSPKYILKKAVEGIIPQEIINRKKQGFGNPISEWLKPEKLISKELTDIIFNSKLREQNVLNYDYIKEIVHAHQYKGIDQNFKIWTLITLSLWYDRWFK